MSDTPSEPPILDVARIVAVLNRHRVSYVVIGGVAAAAWAQRHGVAIRPTEDIDITPERSVANLERLSAALRELDARIRTPSDPQGLRFDHDGRSLSRAQMWNLICSAGPLDLSLLPSGTAGYEDLERNAVLVVVDGLDVPIADLADIIRSKRAANRPKDLADLPPLEEALRRRDGK